jgi:hypothetical protein
VVLYCDFVFDVCQGPKEWLQLWLSLIALFISVISLITAIWFASRTFRPIVTVAVKTRSGSSSGITYDLVVLNSGSIPARDIRLVADVKNIEAALANAEPFKGARKPGLACFDDSCSIPILQNGSKTSCYFGTTSADDTGFWKYGATIPVSVNYKGWFGKAYSEKQAIYVRDSESFTGYSWD